MMIWIWLFVCIHLHMELATSCQIHEIIMGWIVHNCRGCGNTFTGWFLSFMLPTSHCRIVLNGFNTVELVNSQDWSKETKNKTAQRSKNAHDMSGYGCGNGVSKVAQRQHSTTGHWQGKTFRHNRYQSKVQSDMAGPIWISTQHCRSTFEEAIGHCRLFHGMQRGRTGQCKGSVCQSSQVTSHHITSHHGDRVQKQSILPPKQAMVAPFCEWSFNRVRRWSVWQEKSEFEWKQGAKMPWSNDFTVDSLIPKQTSFESDQQDGTMFLVVEDHSNPMQIFTEIALGAWLLNHRRWPCSCAAEDCAQIVTQHKCLGLGHWQASCSGQIFGDGESRELENDWKHHRIPGIKSVLIGGHLQAPQASAIPPVNWFG